MKSQYQCQQLPIFKLTRLLNFPKAGIRNPPLQESSKLGALSGRRSITTVCSSGNSEMNFIAVVNGFSDVYVWFERANGTPILKLLPLKKVSCLTFNKFFNGYSKILYCEMTIYLFFLYLLFFYYFLFLSSFFLFLSPFFSLSYLFFSFFFFFFSYNE